MGARSGAAVQISRVSSKGQVTLPKSVRDAIGVGPGDVVAYDVANGAVTLRRLGRAVTREVTTSTVP